MIRKTLKFLYILQDKVEKNSMGYKYTKRRVNPFNPLSYIMLLSVFVLGILAFGFIGFWKEVDKRNIFKYH